MTANLLHQRCDAADFARVLEGTDPDVVVTQELGPWCADVLAGAYPNHHLRPALGFLGRGIATRLDVRFGEIDMPGRPATTATFDLAPGRLRLAGVHLLNPIQFPWWDMARIRRRQIDALVEWLEAPGEEGPVVVAGDFNASPIWPVYRRVSRHLDDLVSVWGVRSGQEPEPTWGWRPGWPRMLRIDHVFGSSVRADDVRVVPISGSDHAAVVADLTVEDQSAVPG